MGTEKINYEHWQKIIKKAIIGMSICQFCVEVVVNTLLFLTEQQGYNQNTVVGQTDSISAYDNTIQFGCNDDLLFFVS